VILHDLDRVQITKIMALCVEIGRASAQPFG
jgi:hypothetical protein